MAKMPSTMTQAQRPPCTVTTSSTASTATTATAAPVVSVSSRIPATLQAVFLASNRGQVVHKPPPTKVASKTYFRNWLFQGSRSCDSNNKTSSGKTTQRSSLFSFKNNRNGSSSSSTTTTTSSSSTLPSGMRSPSRTTTSSNGSKYKIGSNTSGHSKNKQTTDALVNAASKRLEQTQQQQQQSSSVIVPDKENKNNPTAAAPSPTQTQVASAVSITNVSSENESSDSSVANNNNNNTSSSQIDSPAVSVTPQPEPVSPQDYLDNLLSSRGYSTKRYETLQTGYYNKPTPLQIASYHVHLINLARNQEIHNVATLINSGLSPNPCNIHGESLLHTICRRGLHTVLQIMLEKCHSIVEVSDDYGRTLLHDAMWNNIPSLATISLLLKFGKDASTLFFMQDARGALPLQYTRHEHWSIWIEYLNLIKDEYWPIIIKEESVAVKEPSPLLSSAPNSHPIPDPIHALPLDVAVLVASGKLSPAEAVFLVDDDENDDDNSDDDDDDDESSNDNDDMSQESYDDDSDDEDDDDSSSSSSWDDEEMDDMLQQLPITAVAAAKMK